MWLELNARIEPQHSTAAQSRIDTGHQVGDIARQLADPEHKGVLLDAQRDGFENVFKRTAELLQTPQPIFEAGFKTDNALAFADIMLPDAQSGANEWHMVEVKSSGSVKAYHLDDIAIQSHIARQAGVPLKTVALAHIDTSFVYPGNGKYFGLLKASDLTEATFARSEEIATLITEAQHVAELPEAPDIAIGPQCHKPFECGFLFYCAEGLAIGETEGAADAGFDINVIPGPYTKDFRLFKEAHPDAALADIPEALLNDMQKRVRDCSLTGEIYFDADAAKKSTHPNKRPAYFVDFETINLAVPIWAGTKPYQQIPFQYSLHVLDENNQLQHCEFLDLSGEDPSRQFAETLIQHMGEHGPVYVYNAAFEGGKLAELANRYADLSPALLAIRKRLVDLQPITKHNYYHPDQYGSWSIKNVLPTVAPELSYQQLNGVQDGQMAIDAYYEAIQPETTPARKAEIHNQLLAYCKLDTLAMVKLWEYLAGVSLPDFEN